MVDLFLLINSKPSKPSTSTTQKMVYLQGRKKTQICCGCAVLSHATSLIKGFGFDSLSRTCTECACSLSLPGSPADSVLSPASSHSQKKKHYCEVNWKLYSVCRCECLSPCSPALNSQPVQRVTLLSYDGIPGSMAVSIQTKDNNIVWEQQFSRRISQVKKHLIKSSQLWLQISRSLFFYIRYSYYRIKGSCHLNKSQMTILSNTHANTYINWDAKCY